MDDENLLEQKIEEIVGMASLQGKVFPWIAAILAIFGISVRAYGNSDLGTLMFFLAGISLFLGVANRLFAWWARKNWLKPPDKTGNGESDGSDQTGDAG